MCTTSSSPKKHRTTASSRAAAAFVAALLAGACGARDRETFVTYFNGDHGVSLRRAASWHTDQAEQEGVWYRYFLPPGPASPAPLSVTLLAGAMTVPVDEYAQSYLAGHTVGSTRPEERQGVGGRSWVFSSADGKTSYRLLLLARAGRVLGLYAQGEAAVMVQQSAVLDEMFSSLTIERPDLYPVVEFKNQRASLGLPWSWRETRRFSGGGTLVANYVSPPLAVDKEQGVHASLAVTFEAVPEGGGLAEYYEATRRRLGENFHVRSHASFRGGYVDTMRTETPVAVSFVKRYYFAEGGRGCSLSFEAREDIFLRASRWADYVVSTLRFGGPEEASK
jgi:hypothetical protein